jgi:hypothetical protein
MKGNVLSKIKKNMDKSNIIKVPKLERKEWQK